MATTLADVMAFLEGLSCDELVPLSKEIDRLYSIKANPVIQNLPSELLFPIFKMVSPDKTPIAQGWASRGNPEPAINLRFWLSARTVSKSWKCTLSKIDFSQLVPQIPPKFTASKLLEIFKYTSLEPSSPVDVAQLTAVKSLTIVTGSLPVPQLALLPSLTQLTRLTLHSAGRPSDLPQALLQLTNLQELTLVRAREIECLTTLTKLHTLEFHGPTQIQQSQLLPMTNLQNLLVEDFPSFFRSGRGVCRYLGQGTYDGEWKEGQQHGHGIFSDVGNQTTFEGEWHCNLRHGPGAFACKGAHFVGVWENNQIVKGTCTYANGDRYTGDCPDGLRQGVGSYEFADGTKVEGLWRKDRFEDFQDDETRTRLGDRFCRVPLVTHKCNPWSRK